MRIFSLKFMRHKNLKLLHFKRPKSYKMHKSRSSNKNSWQTYFQRLIDNCFHVKDLKMELDSPPIPKGFPHNQFGPFENI